jgi:tetratricopeptide (TPR) repeat protein
MLVGILSRRCFHCVEIDEFTGPNHVVEHVDTLVGTRCPLCDTVIRKGELDLVIDSESPRMIEENRARWNPRDDRPGTFSRFFAGTKDSAVGDIAGKLMSKVDAAARQRRQSRCAAGTAAMVPLVMSHGREANHAGETDEAVKAFQVCVEHGDELNTSVASFFLGRIEQERNNPKVAVRCFERAAQSSEIELRAISLLYQGLALHELNDREGALRCYQQCVDCGESTVLGGAAYRLGLLLEVLDDRSGARTAYETAVHCKNVGDSTRAALSLALMEEADGRWAKAKKLWMYAHTSPSDETRTVAAFNLGRAAETEGKIRRARKFYRVAVGSPHREAAERARERLAELEE